MIDAAWIAQAIQIVESGVADKLVKDNATVYRVVNIIRIDVNTKEVQKHNG